MQDNGTSEQNLNLNKIFEVTCVHVKIEKHCSREQGPCPVFCCRGAFSLDFPHYLRLLPKNWNDQLTS